jgi:hypothetical protein
LRRKRKDLTFLADYFFVYWKIPLLLLLLAFMIYMVGWGLQAFRKQKELVHVFGLDPTRGVAVVIFGSSRFAFSRDTHHSA